ncbi:cyclic AMP-responsive element-binding protein 3-like protein 3-B [Oppia nitens]|uniref:cyclic AMP-responsive element-binding protein 3-like protein 3-B n=1 Tax=Oppia nitens TaxID=1686743 RepID=UPI0023D9E477|nr:cyclic AMP-responsive element-binding protein 3-like protein 3-B [Oppia nitens]
MSKLLEDMNVSDEFHMSSNSLMSTFDANLDDDDMAFEFSQMVDNNDPWIGNGVIDSINMFSGQMFDEDFNTDSSKSSVSLSPEPVNIKCEVEIDNEIEINSDDFNDCNVDSPASYTESTGSSSSSTTHHHHNSDSSSNNNINHNTTNGIDFSKVVVLNAQNIKKEPKEYTSGTSSTKSSPKTSPKSRTPRNMKITDLVLTDEEKRLLAKEGYHDFPSGTLPLTKHEEKILRKIRRKIRNKKSAQCSRQRKKEYLEDLERRFDERNHENELLKKEVIKLKKENDTLLVKMKKILSMNGPNASFKSSFFVIILSFLLILVPYFRPDVEEYGLNEKDVVGTGRHLLATLAGDSHHEFDNTNDTIINMTTKMFSDF